MKRSKVVCINIQIPNTNKESIGRFLNSTRMMKKPLFSSRRRKFTSGFGISVAVLILMNLLTSSKLIILEDPISNAMVENTPHYMRFLMDSPLNRNRVDDNPVEMKMRLSTEENQNTQINFTSQLPFKPFIPWKRRKDHPLPCIIDRTRPADWDPMNAYIQKQPSDTGLLYIKIEKAASSTLASVAGRIAHAMAHRTNAYVTKVDDDGNENKDGIEVRKVCRFRGLSHLWAKRTKSYNKRDRDQSFLWTFLKDPMQRELSLYFYFYLDWGIKHNYTVDSFHDWLGRHSDGNEQTTMLADEKAKRDFDEMMLQQNTNETMLDDFVQKTIDEMDFIGLVERMDESLVLLALMLDLPVTDVLYTSSKQSGDYTLIEKQKRCERIGIHRPLLPGIKDYFESVEWEQRARVDRMLHAAVNRSIDHTIEHVVGREIFDEAMREFMDAKKVVSDHCTINSRIVLACTEDGGVVPQADRSKCYLSDAGCGHECLDEVFPFQS
mmetsp:Transcript_29065/g.44358  ORF Transcript_29065/g.44358 Transcript_29065/m.44358 type:complete len:494 (+) Transcript_29065:41-1522(+)